MMKTNVTAAWSWGVPRHKVDLVMIYRTLIGIYGLATKYLGLMEVMLEVLNVNQWLL